MDNYGRYRTDADTFERDRKHAENLKVLSQVYGVKPDRVLAAIRGHALQCGTYNGLDKLAPRASDFDGHRTLTDPELAELVVRRIFEKWNELEDCPDFLKDISL